MAYDKESHLDGAKYGKGRGRVKIMRDRGYCIATEHMDTKRRGDFIVARGTKVPGIKGSPPVCLCDTLLQISLKVK